MFHDQKHAANFRVMGLEKMFMACFGLISI